MTVYAIPNYECNLSCPHCELHEKHIEFKPEAFYAKLQAFSSADHITLFGGEPTLFPDRFAKCLSFPSVKSVSTNLLGLSDIAFSSLLTSHASIATSWNLTRFAPLQYKAWLKNLAKLKIKKCMVMVTMTQDLVTDHGYKRFLSVLKDIDQTQGCNKVLLEHYIGSYATEDYNHLCDQWLCRIHSDWTFSFENSIEKKLREGWTHDCNDTWTLEPDGNFHRGCPQAQDITPTLCLAECLSCKYAAHCRPCTLQHACSYPKQLAAILQHEASQQAASTTPKMGQEPVSHISHISHIS